MMENGKFHAVRIGIKSLVFSKYDQGKVVAKPDECFYVPRKSILVSIDTKPVFS